MIEELDHFYLDQEEPIKGTLLALKDIILALDSDISPAWKYKAPFFLYKGKMFCYLWIDKKTNEPYIGIVEGLRIEHPILEQGNRSKMKILRVNPNQDIPIKEIQFILNKALDFYRNGTIKTKRA